jgi:hypothetical protein
VDIVHHMSFYFLYHYERKMLHIVVIARLLAIENPPCHVQVIVDA